MASLKNDLTPVHGCLLQYIDAAFTFPELSDPQVSDSDSFRLPNLKQLKHKYELKISYQTPHGVHSQNTELISAAE